MKYILLLLAVGLVTPFRTYAFSEEETNTIDGIAMMCPVLGGPAVFMARAMQASYLGTVYYDDVVLCAKQDIAYLTTRSGPKVAQATLLPNPSNGFVQLAFPTALEGESQLMLYDLHGRNMATVNVPANTKLHSFDLSQLIAATYMYRLVSTNGIEATGKLVLVKE